MLAQYIRNLVIRPALKEAGLWSEAADILIFGTGLIESGYQKLKQDKNGPALGFWQIEPETHKAIKIWLTNRFNKDMIVRILAASHMEQLPSDDEPLIYNLRYSCLIARMKYWTTTKLKLPEATDATALSYYHKKYYNSYKGDSDPIKNIEVFKKAIEDKG